MEKQLAMCWTLSVGEGMRHKSRSHSVKDTQTLRTLMLSESPFPAVFKVKQHFNPTLCVEISRRLKCAMDAGGAVLVMMVKGRSSPATALSPAQPPEPDSIAGQGLQALESGVLPASHRHTETYKGAHQQEQKIGRLNTKQRRYSVSQEEQKFRISSIHVCHMLSVQQLP